MIRFWQLQAQLQQGKILLSFFLQKAVVFPDPWHQFLSLAFIHKELLNACKCFCVPGSVMALIILCARTLLITVRIAVKN